MVQLSQQTYDIQRVREVVPCAKGMQIVLAGGRLVLWLSAVGPNQPEVKQVGLDLDIRDQLELVAIELERRLDLLDSHAHVIDAGEHPRESIGVLGLARRRRDEGSV